MVKRLLITTLLFLNIQALRADELPDPVTWFRELPESWQSQPTMLRNMTVRAGAGNGTDRWDRAMEDFSDLGFIQYIPGDDVNFAVSLNSGAEPVTMPQEFQFDPELLQMVLIDEKSKMTVQVNSKKTFRKLGGWPITAKDRKNSKHFLLWLTRNLGYDAIVLDFRDGFILAGLLTRTDELGQGLLVKSSSRRWLIKPEKSQGEALLQMLKIDGSLAIFEVLLAGGESIQVEKGSKILLGTNKNWKKMMKSDGSPSRKEPTPPAVP